MIKKPISSTLLLIYFLILGSSCSQVQKQWEGEEVQKKPQEVTYSEETKRTFEEIERDLLIERYKRMRVEDGIMQQRPGQRYRPTPRGVSPHEMGPPLSRPVKKTVRPTRAKPAPAPAPKKRAQKVLVDIEAQQREINQNLSYFCMKVRKQNRFKDDASCEDFTQSVRRECLDKFDEGDRALTQCVKSRL